MSKPIILTMKWGSAFSSDCVNVLYNACRGACVQDFRFVCLTDDPTGFVREIEHYPIPNIGLTQDEWYTSGVWPKLSIYSPNLHNLKGRCLFIDLDMMVLNDLDSLLDLPEPFVTTDMGKGWRPGGNEYPPEAGTSIFAFNIGQEVQILNEFVANKALVKREYQNEQDFVGQHASSMAYWPQGWVISFKRWLRQPIGKDLFVQPRMPPPGTKILAFHGVPRPVDLLKSRLNFWDRFPHMGYGRVEWVADYWERNGGRLP